MRTTVDLDPDLHAEAQQRAEAERVTLSAVVNAALRRELRPVEPPTIDPVTGFAVIRLGYDVTADDVADALDD